MMCKKNSLIVAVCLLLASSLAFADVKVGLVDKQVLIQESLYAKSVQEKMKKDFAARQEILVGREKELMSKYEALERDKDVIAEAERGKKERELVKMKQSLQEDGEAFQRDVMQRQEKEGAAFDKVVGEVLAEIAKKKN